MIRIGDFSKLSRISVKTLRYYDEMGLLQPVQVDPFTGYRLYEYSQLSDLNRILALKDLGFSLEEIGRLLDDGLSLEQMRGCSSCGKQKPGRGSRRKRSDLSASERG